MKGCVQWNPRLRLKRSLTQAGLKPGAVEIMTRMFCSCMYTVLDIDRMCSSSVTERSQDTVCESPPLGL